MNLAAAKVISMNAAVAAVYVQSRLLLVELALASYSVVFPVER